MSGEGGTAGTRNNLDSEVMANHNYFAVNIIKNISSGNYFGIKTLRMSSARVGNIGINKAPKQRKNTIHIH